MVEGCMVERHMVEGRKVEEHMVKWIFRDAADQNLSGTEYSEIDN